MGSRPTPLAWAALALCLLFTMLGIYAAYSRGLWLDESWGIFEGKRDLSFVDALHKRWLFEASPPYFYMFAWAFEPLTGDEIFGRRLLNLIPLGLTALAFLKLRRRYSAHAGFVLLLGILILSHPHAMAYFAEHRAYFAILAGASLLAAVFGLIALREQDYARSDRILLLLASAGMLTVFSLHYIVAFEVGLISGVFIAAFWLSGLRRWAIALALAGFVAALPILGAFLAQHQVLSEVAGTGWIHASIFKVLFFVLLMVATTLAVASVAAVGMLRNLRAKAGRSEGYFARVSLIALSVSIATILIANSWQSMIVERYLIAYVPFILAPVAALSARAIADDRVLLWGVGVFAAVLIAYLGWSTAREGRWYRTARMIVAARDACPSTTVHAIPFWLVRDRPFSIGPNEPEVLRLGIGQVARRFGLVVQPGSSREISRDCPTILWVEHFYGPMPDAQRVVGASGLPFTAEAVAAAANYAGETGFITVVPPQANRATPRTGL